jgi:hypothetical protein
MSITNKVICIDTGRQCGYSAGLGCTHAVILYLQDGNWEFLGPKTRREILTLHESHGLTPHPHFLDESSAGGMAYNQ